MPVAASDLAALTGAVLLAGGWRRGLSQVDPRCRHALEGVHQMMAVISSLDEGRWYADRQQPVQRLGDCPRGIKYSYPSDFCVAARNHRYLACGFAALLLLLLPNRAGLIYAGAACCCARCAVASSGLRGWRAAKNAMNASPASSTGMPSRPTRSRPNSAATLHTA